MKKFLITFAILITIILTISTSHICALTLQTGISLNDQVPEGFFGSWKITSVMTYSNNPNIFNETTTDYWNLSKVGNVITLTNPISGAIASVTVEDVKGNKITFSHVTKGKLGKMTETPTLTLNGENFSGTDKIIIEKYKNGKLISSDTVIYKINAEKVSGSSAKYIFSKNN